jgi:ubiquinone/menaquinone biosynthesis C-methylase UbiE
MDYASLATKYIGETAAAYEQRRDQDRKWHSEEEAASELLRWVKRGARTLDVPVGTGRLLKHMRARHFEVHGLDISPDMLAVAQAQADSVGMNARLGLGDIRHIPFADDSFDVVTCLRFLNWVDADGVEQAVTELARVSRDKLMLGIRYLSPPDEIRRHTWPMVRLSMRAMGASRRRERRSGLCFHERGFVHRLFNRLGLAIVEERIIERALDGTDYVFFLLGKH